jgi:alpha-D-ribose 1-methylphosphonate 5-triphosphate synthase subunit PhnI
MSYVAVSGGSEAIENAVDLVRYYRLGQSDASISLEHIEKQLRLLIDKLMGEGGLYAPAYAALALKQAEGDPFEAGFLLRAFRSTLQRNHVSETIDTSRMRVIRRISSSFRDIPGGQLLGPTYDYTHRLLDFALRQENEGSVRDFIRHFLFEGETIEAAEDETQEELPSVLPKIVDMLRAQGLMKEKTEVAEEPPYDITRQKTVFPLPRSARMQMLARGETGAMTAIAYSSLRGYGQVHPTIGELRVGYVDVHVRHPYAKEGEDASLYIGEMLVTEVESINSFKTDPESGDIQFELGYGLCFGQNEVKGISMAILERSLESGGNAPAQDEEFVLMHIDSVESTGYVTHFKLPHFVTFTSSLDRIRQVRGNAAEKKEQVEQK